MRRRGNALIALAGIGAAVLGLWLLWSEPVVVEKQRPRVTREADLPPAPNLDFGTTDEVERGFHVAPPAPDADEEPVGALPGERVWSVADGEALEALIARAAAAGLTVHSTIPALGVIHVSGDDAALRAVRPDDTEEEYVYRVELPTYPEPNEFSTEGLASFEAGALGFLGVEDVPASWGEGVRVAVLDTGVAAHEAFAGADIVQTRLGEVSELGDANGHGTAMTGVLVGREDDYARGLAPGATVLSVPVLGPDGRGNTFDLARGIVEAADAGVNVINISAGSVQSSTTLARAVDYAQARDAVIVAATGNEGTGVIRYPAAYEDVIGVTTVDAQGRLPSFANVAETVDIAAPGVGIYSAWIDDSYISMSGSSAAAPFVAGTIAMLMSETPGLSAREAATLVQQYTDEAGAPGPDAAFGAGILNLERLERRNQADVNDLAVVTPHLALREATESEIPLYLSLQNRGTTRLAQTRLDLEVDGITYTYTVGDLEAGESGGVRIPVPVSASTSDAGVSVKMRASYRGDATDASPENDALEAFLQLSPDESENVD